MLSTCVVVLSCCTRVDFLPDPAMPAGAYALLLPQPVARSASLGVVNVKWTAAGQSVGWRANAACTRYFCFGDARRQYKLLLCVPPGAKNAGCEVVFTPSEVTAISLSPSGITLHRE